MNKKSYPLDHCLSQSKHNWMQAGIEMDPYKKEHFRNLARLWEKRARKAKRDHNVELSCEATAETERKGNQ